MHPHADTLDRFYRAFAALDPDGMAPCYAPDVRFRDPVFTLQGRDEVMGMWRMLCEAVRARGRDDWKLDYSEISADGTQGQAHWDAHYRFSATGRLVLNRIDARMRFDTDGLIVEHTDSFDFWRWSRQALGTPGLLLGWTPLLRNQVRAKARAGLDKYLATKR
jgi:SnoaL-like domain